ncbi:MAG TPA: dihydrofolate reductase family protein [Candidatus Didemnitutus sp.]|nr:dihydrofolate reductase family protein [Candidatus Didemnitutus sp.]
MSRVRVHAFTISADGFGAGPGQDRDNPLGRGGSALHGWMYPTRTFQRMIGGEGGTTGKDDELARTSFDNVGAWILGRNMFGPVRGPWPDESWKGWWGDEPPYHVPVFVLTHHARASIPMAGGTTFHFVTDGIQAALAQAKAAAGDKDVRIGGGVSTIQQYLRLGVIDEIHLAISPCVLGAGESLFAGINLVALGYRVREHVTTPDALHVIIAKG